MGGESKRRKMESRIAVAVAAAKVASTQPSDNSSSGRFFRFAENNVSLTVMGLVGSLGSLLLYGPILAFCVFLLPLGLHRSKAMNGFSVGKQSLYYVLLISISGCVLFCMGRSIESHKEHPLTAEEIWRGHTSQPAPQTTNIYQAPAPPSPPPIEEPRIELSEFKPQVSNIGVLSWYTNAINTGKVPAIDVEGSTEGIVGVVGSQTEDDLFIHLRKISKDAVQPHADQSPGPNHMTLEPTVVELSNEQKVDIQRGAKSLYLGRLDAYKDSRGNKYVSELCMYMMQSSTNLLYCNAHNSVRKLSK